MKIISDGSRHNTKLIQDNQEVPFKTIAIWIENKLSNVLVDGKLVDIELIAFDGVYTFVSDGTFGHSKLLIEEVQLRCIESIYIWLGENDKVFKFEVQGLFTPNIVVVNDDT